MKKSVFHSIIFLISFLLLQSGCKKIDNNEADATIYVKEYKTETPIANAMVLITRGRPGSGVGSSVVDTLFTDSNGKAGYGKTLDAKYMYYAEAYKETYFDTHSNQVSVTLGKKNFKTTIYMYAYSYVKLHVKNVNPVNQFDLIYISTYCYNFYLQGMNIDTTFLYCDYGFEFMGNFNYNDAFSYIKNNTNQTYYFSYTPPPPQLASSCKKRLKFSRCSILLVMTVNNSLKYSYFDSVSQTDFIS